MTAPAGTRRHAKVPRLLQLQIAVSCLVCPPLLEFVPLHHLVRSRNSVLLIEIDESLDDGVRDATRHEVQAIARHVDHLLSSAPSVWRRTCLRRSLVLQRILTSLGYDVALIIGVRKTAAKLEAHAWLESRGKPILEALPEDLFSFRVLTRLPIPA